jgi:hypothetical protein
VVCGLNEVLGLVSRGYVFFPVACCFPVLPSFSRTALTSCTWHIHSGAMCKITFVWQKEMTARVGGEDFTQME